MNNSKRNYHGGPEVTSRGFSRHLSATAYTSKFWVGELIIHPAARKAPGFGFLSMGTAYVVGYPGLYETFSTLSDAIRYHAVVRDLKDDVYRVRVSPTVRIRGERHLIAEVSTDSTVDWSKAWK